jgi:hypothetical protein
MWTSGSSIDGAETVSEALPAGRDGGSTVTTQLLTTFRVLRQTGRFRGSLSEPIPILGQPYFW